MADLIEIVNQEEAIKLVRRDLQKSGITQATALINFEPICGVYAFDHIYGDRAVTIKGRPGSLNSKWAKRLAQFEDFIGWICNDRIKWLGGTPIYDENGKQIRYFTRLGFVSPITFIVPCPEDVALAEARFKRKKPDGMTFWEWVRVELLPIVIVEGEKKAAALLGIGIPAISLPGIFTGFNAIRDDWGKTVERLLREELKPFDNSGRSVCIMFDHREGEEFSKTVEFQAAAILSRQFKEATVRVAELPGPEKGVDDYLVIGKIREVEDALIAAKPACKYEHERLWREYRTFNVGGKKTYDLFFDAPEPEPNTATILASNLNSGKSEWVANKISKVVAFELNGKIVKRSTAKGVMVSLGHRNSLQYQLCRRWDFDHLDLHNAYGRLSDPDLHVALCFDSILKLPREMFPGATVLLDESLTGIKHLLMSKTLKYKRLEIIRMFEYIIRVCSRVILMDGFNTDFLVDYIRQISGKEIHIYENESPRATPPIYFVDDEQIGAKKAVEWINMQILSAKLPAVVVDSITKAEAVAEQLRKLRGEGLEITSKTVTEKWVKTFLDDPDAFIEKYPTRVNWICCTPTIESGVSINTEGKFDTLICWFVGVVGVNEAVQMSRRVRNPQQIIVYAPKVGIQTGQNEGAFEQLLLQNLDARISAEAGIFTTGSLGDKVMATLREQLDSPHVHTWLKFKAIEQLECKNYRDFLKLAFDSMGMHPKTIEAYEIDSTAYREALVDVQQQECQQIYHAEDIDWKEAERLSTKLDANWEDRCKVIKYHILDKMPGLRESPLWSADFIHRLRYRERALSSQLEMFWLLHHPEESKALQAQKWLDKDDVDFFIPDRAGGRWLLIELLTRMGFVKHFLSGDRYADNSECVINFMRAVRMRSTVSAVTGHPGQATNLHFINNKLLKTFGVRPKKQQVRLPPALPGGEGERKYFYCYDPDKCHPENWAELIGFVDRRFNILLGNGDPQLAPESHTPIAPNPDADALPDMGDDRVITSEKIENENENVTLDPVDSEAVSSADIILQTTEGSKAESQQPPNFGASEVRSAANPMDASDGAIGDSGTRSDEEAHKFDHDDFVSVWVQTRRDDRPKIELARLIDCEGDGFKVDIGGEVWLVPVADLFWEPPAPS